MREEEERSEGRRGVRREERSEERRGEERRGGEERSEERSIWCVVVVTSGKTLSTKASVFPPPSLCYTLLLFSLSLSLLPSLQCVLSLPLLHWRTTVPHVTLHFSSPMQTSLGLIGRAQADLWYSLGICSCSV